LSSSARLKSRAQPSVQGAYMKNLFSELEKRGKLAAISARDADLVAEIERASRAGWLPVALNVRTVEAIASIAGERRGLEILAECVFAQFETPLWKNLIAPALRLLGRNPGSLGRWIPAAIRVIFRGCGTWSVERTGETELRVDVHNLPEALAQERLWLRSLGIGMSALFPLSEVDGRADLATYEPAQRRASFTLRWKADA